MQQTPKKKEKADETYYRMSLLRPLGHVQSVVERRNTIPILANVVLRAEDGELALTATDMDMDIVTEVGCSVMTPGTTTCLFYTILRVNCLMVQKLTFPLVMVMPESVLNALVLGCQHCRLRIFSD